MSLDTPMLSEDWVGGPAARSAGGVEGQRPASASEASALGSTQSYCFTPPESVLVGVDSAERRRIRWGARAMLWQASSLKAVRCCGRVLHNDAVGDPDDGQTVIVKRREVDGRPVASYHGLMTCGSVWSCPRCSAVIAHTRAEEIGSAVRECHRQGGRVYLMTLTMRHTSRDRLAELWDGLSSGWRAAFGARSWTGQKARTVERRGQLSDIAEIIGDAERFGVAGLTRVVEATYGAARDGGHGWHLHIHALVFATGSLATGLDDLGVRELGDAHGRRKRSIDGIRDCVSDQWGACVDWEWLSRNIFAARVHSRWSAGLSKSGFVAPGWVGVDVREVSDSGSEYLSQYLAKATYDVAAKIGLEVGAGQVTKSGRVARNRTPFEILAGLSESVDARGFGVRTPRQWSVVEAGGGDWAVLDSETGEVIAVTPPGEWRIWHEWEQVSKGRRQIVWSRRRKSPASSREVLWNLLLDSRGQTAESSDEEVAAAESGGEVVAEISRSDWYRVLAWRPSLMVEVLEAAEKLGANGFRDRLAALLDGASPDGLAMCEEADVG